MLSLVDAQTHESNYRYNMWEYLEWSLNGAWPVEDRPRFYYNALYLRFQRGYYWRWF